MSELKVKGVVEQILKGESGTSKAGKDWNKKDFVIETTEDQYPKKICFTLFGDKTDLLSKISEGMNVEVYFNLESREYNERWFHNVNAWRIQPEEAGEQAPLEDIPPETLTPEQDDLPF